jgi:hypothetical protein
VKPEDCVFGDSIGEGRFIFSQQHVCQPFLNYRCFWQRKSWMAKR